MNDTGKVVSDHAVKPHRKFFWLNPSCHAEYPRTPEAVPMSVSLPKRPASPRCQAPNTPLDNRCICSGSLPDLSHYVPTDFWVQLHIHTTWTFSWLPNIPAQDSVFQNLSLCLSFGPAAFFGMKKTHISYFTIFPLLPHLFPFLQTKDILVFEN